jgi:hypothetical protein
MYLLKPSDLNNVIHQQEQSGGAIPQAPPIGSEGMLKTRLGELDRSMQEILQGPSTDIHQKIRLYLEALRQYIMSARHLDRVLQQHQSPQDVQMIDRETQTTVDDDKEPTVAKRQQTTPAALKPVAKEQVTVKQPLSPTTSAPVVSVEAPAEVVQQRPPAAERGIRPARLSFHEIAEQASVSPYSSEVLLSMMPPSRKDEAEKILRKITSSASLRWDPTTGQVYRGNLQKSIGRIDKFLQKRFSTTSEAKGSLAGYDEFKEALGEARAAVNPVQQQQQMGKGKFVWLRY